MLKPPVSPLFQLWLFALLAMIGSIGVSLPYPLFAPLLLSSGHISMFFFHSSIKSPAVLFGLILAVYPLGLFIGSTILGSLSDHYGRQKLIVGSLLSAMIGYVLTAFALHTHNFYE